MSDPALEAHEHAEHAEHAAHEKDPFISRVSITVAVLAVMAAAAGSLETVEGGRAIVNNLAKRWKGTAGQARLERGRWLANHFCERDCELSRQIVAELYSVEEMYWLLDQESEEVATLLAEKMQST